MSDVHDVLVKARNLISDPSMWCQGRIAISGRVCSVGALKVVQNIGLHTGGGDRVPGYQELQRVIGYDDTVATFNDSHSHAEVLAAFDKAIAQTAPSPDLSFLASVTVESEVKVS